MKRRILVAYASRYGSTAEVAHAIGEVLKQSGAEVDIVAMRKVKDVGSYDAMVLGTSIRMEKPLKEALNFFTQHHDALGRVPVAIFSLGLHMREDTPDNREKTKGFLAPLFAVVPNPVSLAFFGGALEHGKLEFLLRFFAARDKSGAMQEGDWRNWDEIRKWAQELIGHFE